MPDPSRRPSRATLGPGGLALIALVVVGGAALTWRFLSSPGGQLGPTPEFEATAPPVAPDPTADGAFSPFSRRR